MGSIINKIVGAYIILLCLLMFFGVLISIIEIVTLETINVESVKCIDKAGNEFEDEYCSQEIECGIISKYLDNERCVLSEQGEQDGN